MMLRKGVLITLVACFALTSPAVGAFRYLFEGMQCPPIATDSFDLSQVGQGQPVVIVFWASWSPRSLVELDDLQEFYQIHGDSGMAIVAVNVDQEELSESAADSITALFVSRGYTFPMILDRGLRLFETFGVMAVPSTGVVDTAGVLRFAPAGYSLATRDRLFDSVLVLMGKKEVGSLQQVLARQYVPDKRALRYYYLGLTLSLQGAVEQARRNLVRSSELDTLFAGPLNLLGEIYMNWNEYDTALAYLSRATRCDSVNVSVLANYSHCLYTLGDTAGARAALDRALEADSFFTPARLVQVRMLLDDLLVDSSLVLLDACREYDQTNPEIPFLMGAALRQAGRHDEAIEKLLMAYRMLTK